MITDKQLISIASDEHQPDEINLWELMIEMAKEMLELRGYSPWEDMAREARKRAKQIRKEKEGE